MTRRVEDAKSLLELGLAIERGDLDDTRVRSLVLSILGAAYNDEIVTLHNQTSSHEHSPQDGFSVFLNGANETQRLICRVASFRFANKCLHL